jgi:hypothetical protein
LTGVGEGVGVEQLAVLQAVDWLSRSAAVHALPPPDADVVTV